jgi:hypothetical protein
VERWSSGNGGPGTESFFSSFFTKLLLLPNSNGLDPLPELEAQPAVPDASLSGTESALLDEATTYGSA